MAIQIEETFQVAAPVEAVWRFFMDPQGVAACMPGAALEQVLDGSTFRGRIKVKVGAITTSYQGRVTLTEVDEAAHSVRMVAEGREAGGGTAKGTMASRLRSLGNGETEVAAQASIDLTGRVMQVGRGMIEGVSHELFLQFVANAKERLEAPAGAASEATTRTQDAIPLLPLLFKVIWSAVVRFFRRLFRRSAAQDAGRT